MWPLVEFPELVRHYAPHFESVFSPAGYVEFERYISGLIVSENKTVEASTGCSSTKAAIKVRSIAG